jgi:ABC-type dipeptide/oligopeptide/nickel transport system permease component
MRHLALPAIALAIVPAALMARFARSSFLEVLGENYIRTARAYGIPPRTILWRLAAKNAMLPLVTVLSLVVPALVIGSVFVEQVFSWPGIGTLLFEGLDARDFAVVQGTTLVVAALVIGMNLAADVSYALLDPRARRP